MKHWYLVYDHGRATVRKVTRKNAKLWEDEHDVVCVRISRETVFKISLKNLFTE